MMSATVQTGETSPRAAAFAGPRGSAQVTRSAAASKRSASVAVEALPEERQDHESRDFDSLLGMVIGVRDANHQTAEFVRKVGLANRRAIANQRLTEDDLRVMDDATQKNRTNPQRGRGHSRLSAVAIQRGQRGQGSLSYLYRPAEAESGGPARSVLDLELHSGRKHAGSGARPDGSDGRPSPTTTRLQPPPGGAVRAGMEQVDDQHYRWPAGREGGVPATTVKRTVESTAPGSAALRPSRAATSPNRPNEVPIVPGKTAAPSTPGASPQGSGLDAGGRQEFSRLSKSAKQTEDKHTLPRATRQKTLEDVQRVIRAALGRHRSVVRLKLSPPELGKLTIDMRMENDTLHLKLVADSPRVRELLLSSSGLLSSSLAESGVTVERYEVLLSDEASERSRSEAGLADHGASDESPQDSSDPSTARLPGDESTSPEDAPGDELLREGRPGLKIGLDVKA